MIGLALRKLEPLRSAALTLAAVAGALCLVATVVAPLAGVRPLIFLSGSMSPTIPAGSLALAKTVDSADIEVGDIVTVRSNNAYVTHRVVDVTQSQGHATLVLRGDGNEVEDDMVYTVSSAPRTEIWVPGLGSVVAWFSHAPGVYVLAGWVAVALGSLRRHRQDSARPSAPPARGGRRPKLVIAWERRYRSGRAWIGPRAQQLARRAAVVGVVVAAPLAAPSPAVAAWTDGATVSGTSITTATLTTPTLTCTDIGTAVRFDWSSPPGVTHYLISYGGLGEPSRVQDREVTVTSMTFDSTQEGRFDVIGKYGSNTWLSARSAQVSYTRGDCK